MIEVKRASEMGDHVRRRISEIFVDGFGMHFTYFSKDKATLVNSFEHMFNLDVFYVAISEGSVVGITISL